MADDCHPDDDRAATNDDPAAINFEANSEEIVSTRFISHVSEQHDIRFTEEVGERE